jgi:hypothetical protein
MGKGVSPVAGITSRILIKKDSHELADLLAFT